MSELRITVDHLRLNYEGPFDANALYKHITALTKEKGFDIWIVKEFEHDTSRGKQIEWQLRPWKQISDNSRYWIKIRVLIYDYIKVDAIVDKKKVKVGNGRVVMYLDGYVELDQLNFWEKIPILHFIRSLYINFIYRMYTENFEQRITYDTYHLYHTIEQFLNIYKSYKVVSKAPPFLAAH